MATVPVADAAEIAARVPCEHRTLHISAAHMPASVVPHFLACRRHPKRLLMLRRVSRTSCLTGRLFCTVGQPLDLTTQVKDSCLANTTVVSVGSTVLTRTAGWLRSPAMTST
jgi:hypothetical protein